MSPAIRLRYRILAEKDSQRPPQTVLPPPVGQPRHVDLTDAEIVAQALADGHPLAKLMRLRAEAAAEVERLLTFLDESEGLAETEEDDPAEEGAEDEASLGAASLYDSGDQTFWAAGNDVDLEDEHDGREPDDECDGRPDEEPSLGWPDARTGQGPGSVGGFDDREAAVEPRVTEGDRRTYFRNRHGNVAPIVGAEWKGR